MKLIKIMLILALALTSTIGAASAQASTNFSTGYIPLFDSSDAVAGQAYQQSRQAYMNLMPMLELLAAQGAITGYNVNSGFGILTVQYQPGADLSPLGTMYNDINEALASINFASTQSDVSAQIFAPHFTVTDECVSGIDLGVSSLLDAVLYLPNGTIIGSLNNILADGTGAKDFCFDSLLYANYQLNSTILSSGDGYMPPKYGIKIKVYDSTKTTLMGTYSVNVPGIQVTNINRGKSQISGKGLPNRNYTIEYTHYDYSIFPPSPTVSILPGTTSAKGAWFQDFGTLPFLGNDMFMIELEVNSNFTLIHHSIVPTIVCGFNFTMIFEQGCQVVGLKNKPSNLTRVRKGTAKVFTPNNIIRDPMMKTIMYDTVAIKPGDIIKDPKAGIPGTKIPKFTMSINATTDFLTVNGPANSFVVIAIFTGGSPFSGPAALDANGTVALDLSGGMDFLSGNKYNIYMLWYSNNGNLFAKMYSPIAQ